MGPEPILWAVVGGLIAAGIGVLANWTTRPQWAQDHPQRVVAAVVVLAVLGAVVAVVASGFAPERTGGGGPPPVATATAAPTTGPPVPTDPPTPSTAPPTTTGSSPTQTAPTDRSEPGEPSFAVAWESPVRLPKVAGLELDRDPPQPVNGATDGVDIRYGNDEALGMRLYPGAYTFALLDDPGAQDPEACYRAVLSLPTEPAEPRQGDVYCVRTSEDRLARLEITEAEYDGVVFRTTVWDLT